MFTITSICRGGGYKYCRTIPIHPNANENGLYPLHRVLIENSLGRLLNTDEIVHHIDGNKENDSLANLEVLFASEHPRVHGKGRIMVAMLCPVCHEGFVRIRSNTHLVQSRSDGQTYCSRRCSRAGQGRDIKTQILAVFRTRACDQCKTFDKEANV